MAKRIDGTFVVHGDGRFASVLRAYIPNYAVVESAAERVHEIPLGRRRIFVIQLPPNSSTTLPLYALLRRARDLKIAQWRFIVLLPSGISHALATRVEGMTGGLVLSDQLSPSELLTKLTEFLRRRFTEADR